ncbi:hypothetical protein ACTFIU_007377 [Dictyostelium citrinum]
MTRKSNYNYLDEDNIEEESPIGLGTSPIAFNIDKDNKNKKRNSVKFNLDTPLPIIKDKSSEGSSSNNNNNDNDNNKNNKNSDKNKINSSLNSISPYLVDYKDDFDFQRSGYDFDDVDYLEDGFDEHSFYKTSYSTRRCIYRILTYIRPQIWYFVFAFLALSITTLCQLALPYCFANGIQEAIRVNLTVNSVNSTDNIIITPTPTTTPTTNITTNPTILDSITSKYTSLFGNPEYDFKWIIIIVIVQTPFLFARYLLFTMAGFSVVTKLKRDLFRSLLTQEVSYFDSNRTGDLKAVIASDSSILQNCITVSLSTLVRCSLQLIGGSLILVFLSWKVTLLMVSFLVILLISFLVFKKWIHPKYNYIQEKLVNIGSIIDDSIGNIKEIRLLNAESKELRSFETELEVLHRSSRSFVLMNAFWISFGSLLVMGTVIGVYGFAMSQTLSNNILLLQFILYSLMITASMNGLIGSINEIQKLISSSKRIFSLIDRKPIVHFQGGITPSTDSNISFDNVYFNLKTINFNNSNNNNNNSNNNNNNSSLNGNNNNGCATNGMILSNVSFVLNKGQWLSLVGPSQSKEFVFSLIQGLYYPSRGTVFIGRIDTKVLDLYFFRNRLFTISPLQTVIFDGTVEQNIRYGLSHLSNQNIIDASKKANLHDFVIGLPHGYDSMIGKNNFFDPIQILKISIARAFLRNPSVLLLDETTLPFDSKEIEDSLELLVQNKTVIVIANKLSTLKRSNNILVFDDNRVIEKGTHSELSQKSTSFYVTSVLNSINSNK